jgi:uncharacterized membrane protein
VLWFADKARSSEKNKMMKTAITTVATLTLTALFGCQSPRGGGMSPGEGFKIGVPTFDTEIKQGEMKTVTVSLHRGESFKRDVELEIRGSKGISVDPTDVTVKASDRPDVQVRIEAARDAAIGEYHVYVKGTPTTGEATSVAFKVKVVAP